MKLSEYAKLHDVTYRTAWQWFKDGKIPELASRSVTGRISLGKTAVPDIDTVTVYARVSSHDQKSDLDAQVGRVCAWAAANGMVVGDVITEIASGLNGHRKQLRRLLANSEARLIAVEHQDRLVRFGYEYVVAALAAQGRKVLVAGAGEVKDDLVHDMIDILTSFCARLYGRRSAANRAKRAIDAAAQ